MPGLTSIPSRAGFLRARNHGVKAVARGVVMQAVANDLPDWRVGYTATKKIGNAVTRNRARRRLRALVRDNLLSEAMPGVDYVMIARFETATCAWADLVADAQKAINHLHKNLGSVDKSAPNQRPKKTPKVPVARGAQ